MEVLLTLLVILVEYGYAHSSLFCPSYSVTPFQETHPVAVAHVLFTY